MEASFVGGKEADEVEKSRSISVTNAISLLSSRTLRKSLVGPPTYIVWTLLLQLGTFLPSVKILGTQPTLSGMVDGIPLMKWTLHRQSCLESSHFIPRYGHYPMFSLLWVGGKDKKTHCRDLCVSVGTVYSTATDWHRVLRVTL